MKGIFWINLKEDVKVFINQEFGENLSPKSLLKNSLKLIFVQGFVAVFVYRLGVALYSIRGPYIYPFKMAYFFLVKFVEITTGVMIPVSVKAGKGLYIGHFGYIIINGHCEIGDFCQIGPGVVLGTKGLGHKGVPRLGNNVYIGSGAKVLGPVKIGNNVAIGANSVVLSDVPDSMTVVGSPARIVNMRSASEQTKECTFPATADLGK